MSPLTKPSDETPDFRELPHTGLRVPADAEVPYITDARTIGSATEADLYLGSLGPLGRLYYEGVEDEESEFEPFNRRAEKAMAVFVEGCVRVDPTMNADLVYSELVREYGMACLIEDATKRGRFFVRAMCHSLGLWHYAGTADIHHWPLAEPDRRVVVAELASIYPATEVHWEVWFNCAWVPMDPGSHPYAQG